MTWQSYRAAHSDLSRRIASAASSLSNARNELGETRRSNEWLEPLGSAPIPLELKRNELGLAHVAPVTLLEVRRMEGQSVWTPVDTGAVSFTDRRAVFSGSKKVAFEYKDLTFSGLEPAGLHLAVSRRKASHILAGPAQQLSVTLDACRSIGEGIDPLPPLREAEQEAVSAVASLQGELDDPNHARRDLGRPSRPFSPAWAPLTAALLVLFAGSGLATMSQLSVSAGEAVTSTTVVAETTPTTSERQTTSPLAQTTTTVGLQTVIVQVASITDGDTFRVIMPDGTNEPVRLIGIDAPEPGAYLFAESKGYLASLTEDAEVTLMPDVSDRDRFDRFLRYVYVGGLFVNQAMVESGYAIARDYPPDSAEAANLAAAAARAQAAGLGLWTPTTTITTTTTTPTTTTTTAPSTTAAPVSNCHPSYEGACLQMGIGGYDCAGGSGNGPNYVEGPVYVVGPDEFDLDRDGDGIGCES